jgi:hypothetical protein
MSHRYLAVPVLLLIDAYLRIVFALCAAVAWVRGKFQASRARMTESRSCSTTRPAELTRRTDKWP